MKERHIGLIGFGAIGQDVVSLMSRASAPVRVTLLRRSAGELDFAGRNVTQVASAAELLAARPALVVEAAGHAAMRDLVPQILDAGVSVVAASAGSLVQDHGGEWLYLALQKRAVATGARIIIPAGAIGGLDYLAAVAGMPDLSVLYTSRKPPGAWRDELETRAISPAAVDGEIVLFEGSVEEAARLYPKNLNVAATLALVIGDPARIGVRVVVDSRARGNTHEIDASSSAGTARFEFINAPAPANPKTSMVTALSVVRAIEDFFDISERRAGGA